MICRLRGHRWERVRWITRTGTGRRCERCKRREWRRDGSTYWIHVA